MHRFRLRIRAQRGAEGVVGEHLGDLRQDLQVLLGDVVRDQQEEQQVDRLAVRRLERDRLGQAHKGR